MPRSASDASHIVLRLPRNSLKIAAIAFGVGVLLFLLVWATGRRHEFYRPDPASAAATQSGAPLQPLPAPLPAGEGASDMPEAPASSTSEAAETPQLVETPPPSIEIAPAMPVPADAAPALPASDRPVPLAGQMPPPRYPPAALRRGDRGTVVVRVEVDATGYPAGVALLQRSGSRELDRAAMEAVRQWRFQPAQRDGRAVPGSLEVPFDFKPAQ